MPILIGNLGFLQSRQLAIPFKVNQVAFDIDKITIKGNLFPFFMKFHYLNYLSYWLTRISPTDNKIKWIYRIISLMNCDFACNEQATLYAHQGKLSCVIHLSYLWIMFSQTNAKCFASFIYGVPFFKLLL